MAAHPRNVFINCAFDAEFEPLFHAIVFTVIRSGFRARCATESDDAGENRFSKIQQIVEECRYGIHDIDVRREPGDGYWSNVWNKQPFCMTFVFGRPTQDQVYSLSYLSTAEWNDTRFVREDFDRLITGARGETDSSIRKEMYHDATMILRDNGGAIIPIFGDFIDAISQKVGGWEDNPNGELMGGQALIKCWMEA